MAISTAAAASAIVFIFLTTIHSISAASIHRQLRSEDCQLLSELETHDSGRGVPVGHVMNDSDVQVVMDLAERHYQRVNYSSTECPESLLDVSLQLGLNRMATCPWEYVIHTDNDRYPTTMLYAQCHCPDCIRSDNSGFDITSGSTCFPVYHKTRVLRKCGGTCSIEGVCRYKPDFELIPVSCTCVRPSASLSGGTE